MASLKVKVSFPASMLEARGLVKLGRLSREDLYLYSWWSILDPKLAVSVKNILGVIHGDIREEDNEAKYVWYAFPYCLYLEFFCFTLILKCGGLYILGLGGRTVKTCCASPLGEANVAASRSTSVGFSTLLECLTWCILPR